MNACLQRAPAVHQCSPRLWFACVAGPGRRPASNRNARRADSVRVYLVLDLYAAHAVLSFSRSGTTGNGGQAITKERLEK
jgi:hypothetical protein